MTKHRRFIRTGVPIGFGLAALAAVLAAPISSLASASPAPVPTFTPGPARYDVGVRHTVTPADVARASGSGALKTFTSSVNDIGGPYTYRIVGKNPAVAKANASKTIATQLVPVVIKLSNGDTFDPTVADSCDPGASSLTRTQNSPIFVPRSWTWGGKSIGSEQYPGAFQRAEFWKYAKPSGINPTYNVNLGLTTLAKVTINVPAGFGAEASIACGSGKLGAVEISWLDSYLQNTLIPSLAGQGVAPNTFPLFLVHNVVEYISTTSNCCVLGYHNSYQPGANIQTYGVTMYDNSGAFSGSSDISVVSHEVGEWVNDPYGNNPTRAWGHIGQVSGCQSNLEVGDPLSGTTFAAPSGGFTYHPQELAFFSWFYRQSPSLGVNGWYSNQGTFTTTQGTCM